MLCVFIFRVCGQRPKCKVDEVTQPQALAAALLQAQRQGRFVALVPPPRAHHRYYGVLAPNSPLRAAALARARHSPSVEGMEPLPGWGEGYQAAPDFEADQRIPS
jgi:hypothetical protein